LIANHFAKGQRIALTGSLQSRKWTTQNGDKRSAVEIVADQITFVENRQGGTQQQDAHHEPAQFDDPFADD